MRLYLCTSSLPDFRLGTRVTEMRHGLCLPGTHSLVPGFASCNCEGPSNIFSFAGRMVSVVTTQLDISSGSA